MNSLARTPEKRRCSRKRDGARTRCSRHPLSRSIFWLAVGLLLLIVSSRILVWGAVENRAWLRRRHSNRRADHCRCRHVPAGTGFVDHRGQERRTRYCSRQHPRVEPFQCAGGGRNCRGNPAAGGRTGSIQSGHSGHGRIDPVAVVIGYGFRGAGPDQPLPRCTADGLLRGVHCFPGRHDIQLAPPEQIEMDRCP